MKATNENGKIETCDALRRGQASAYLDGELDAASSALFEAHLKACVACAAALTEQRRLLAVLNSAFAAEQPRARAAMRLPENFAEIVTARAQTDMNGLSARAERVRALRLSLALAIICALILGIAVIAFGGASAFDAVRAFARASESVLSVVGRAVRDASAGGAVVLRAIGAPFVSSSDPVTLAVWSVFACALIALLHLIGGNRREHASERR